MVRRINNICNNFVCPLCCPFSFEHEKNLHVINKGDKPDLRHCSEKAAKNIQRNLEIGRLPSKAGVSSKTGIVDKYALLG